MQLNKKDVVVISVLANAGLLLILLISALTSRESYLIASSAKVASNILEHNDKGMTAENEEFKTSRQEENSGIEGVIHQLPEIAGAPMENEDAGLETAQAEEENQNIMQSSAKIEEQRPHYIDVTVKNGDSLEKLARRYHVPIREIQKANQLSGSFLKTGQNLKIPAGDSAAAEVQASSRYYTVKPGDNPWTIAMKHHLKPEDLLKMNGLSKQKAKRLKPGDKLKVR